jgi:hypothetical protein
MPLARYHFLNVARRAQCSIAALHDSKAREAPGYIRPLLRRIFSRIGSREFQSARSIQQSSLAMPLTSVWIDFANSGRPSARRL